MKPHHEPGSQLVLDENATTEQASVLQGFTV